MATVAACCDISVSYTLVASYPHESWQLISACIVLWQSNSQRLHTMALMLWLNLVMMMMMMMRGCTRAVDAMV
jgi:hypothetical protein